MLKLYGLPHCGTCKKASAWLAARGIAHQLIDYRKSPLSVAQIEAAAAVLGWDKLANRSSTTWRALSESEKLASSPAQWLALLQTYPTLLKRPLLIDGATIDAGFVEARYATHFAA